jgi:hypothetical protein
VLSSGSGSLVGLLDCADEDTTHPSSASLRKSFESSESRVFHSGVTWMTVLLDFVTVTLLRTVTFAINTFYVL